jgi:hypothetical protein
LAVRPIYIIGGAIVVLALVGVLTWTRFAPAQASTPPPASNPETTRTIIVPEVEVRSGASMSYYATGKLTNGQTVEVVGEAAAPGWLRIKPPLQTQSWINTRFVAVKDKSATVLGDADVPVKAGSSAPNQEPNVEIAKVKVGTQLVVLGDPKMFTDGAWLPIEPTFNEVRYIPESAVTKSGGLQQVSGTAQMPGFVEPPGGCLSPIAQADQEYKNQLLKLTQSTDVATRQQANARLQAFQQMVAMTAPAQQPGYPYSTPSLSSAPPKVVVGTVVGAQGAANTTSAYSLASQQGQGAAHWSTWGTLKATSYIQPDGQTLYRIVDGNGTPLEYAVAAPGYTLKDYVGKTICMYGNTTYCSDARVNYMIVSHVSLPPAH